MEMKTLSEKRTNWGCSGRKKTPHELRGDVERERFKDIETIS